MEDQKTNKKETAENTKQKSKKVSSYSKKKKNKKNISTQHEITSFECYIYYLANRKMYPLNFLIF